MINQKYSDKNFLTDFFQLFKGEVEIAIENEKKISGTIKWPGEEDTQEFVWHIPKSPVVNDDLKILLRFLKEKNLVDSDKIKISEDSLSHELEEIGWDKKRSQTAINLMCSIEVPMIDDGEETDSFFIHF